MIEYIYIVNSSTHHIREENLFICSQHFQNTVAASCPTLTVTNGDVSQTYPEGGTATYTCHSGYTLVDGGPTRTCQAGGNWDGAEPRCIRRCKEHINIHS